MAQQLRRAGDEVTLLALFDGVPPRVTRGQRRSGAVLLAQLLREDARQKGRELDIPAEMLAGVPPRRALRVVLEEARRQGLLTAEVTAGMAQRFLAGFRVRARAADRYRPEVYPGRITYFRAGLRDDRLDALRGAPGGESGDPARGWTRWTDEPVEIHVLDTYHDLLFHEPHVGDLARRLADCIERALDQTLEEAAV